MIERSDRDGILTLRLAHGKASVFDLELMEALDAQLAGAANARALILTGTGSIFSAGVDLFRLTNEGEPYVRRFIPALTRMLETLFTLPIPVVAAVNGHAIAGGCILTAAADYRIMAAGNGRIGAPELLVGVPFPAIALETLRFAWPNEHIEELVYLGKTVLPDEALAKGVIDEIAEPPQLIDRANTIATTLAAIPSASFRIVKRQLRTPVIERTRQFENADRESVEIWCASSTHDHIRSYLSRTVHRK
ncbi:MAG: enoyl-CoA hydratase/isomerase family protein [Thermoanaerobaculia bacterium]|nr:enoyl-CoA hydratase/isomerase family protein [Thermoanaerobaculia bacterium]